MAMNGHIFLEVGIESAKCRTIQSEKNYFKEIINYVDNWHPLKN